MRETNQKIEFNLTDYENLLGKLFVQIIKS